MLKIILSAIICHGLSIVGTGQVANSVKRSQASELPPITYGKNPKAELFRAIKKSKREIAALGSLNSFAL